MKTGLAALSPRAWTLLMVLAVCTCITTLTGCGAPPGTASQLKHLLATNAPCRVRLDPVWTGKATPTARTGFFTNAWSRQNEQFERELRFDWFRYDDKPSRFNFGPRTISRDEGQGSESTIYTWRSSFPSDAELTAATTLDTLERLLGSGNGGFCAVGDGETMRTTDGWAFFRLDEWNQIETVSIFCFVRSRKGDEHPRIESLEVRRGIVVPKKG